MGVNSDVYAADVNIDILSATVKDKRIDARAHNLFLEPQMHRAALIWVLHLLMIKMLY